MGNENDIKLLVQKYVKGNCTREELEKALELFADPYHNLAIRPVLFKMWEKDQESDNDNLPYLKNPDNLLDKIHHRINLDRKKNKYILKKRMQKLLKIAALLVLGLFTGNIIQTLPQKEPVFFTAIAPKGSVSQLILPDNTLVYLNAGSELKFTEEERNILLPGKKGKRKVFLSGEAWFDVKRDDKKPFVVYTSLYQVNVLGTRFNVKAYPDDREIVTTLEDGSLRINSFSYRPQTETKRLQTGEQLVYGRKGEPTVMKVNPRRYSSWKENRLIFINMNLKELFVLLERKYGVDIEVADDIVLDYHYDSTITNESILEVLNLIGETLPIKHKIEGQKIIILKR